MPSCVRLCCILSLLCISHCIYAIDLTPSEIPFSVGGFLSQQGVKQNINFETRVSDEYFVNNNNNFNYLLGLGYYIETFCDDFKWLGVGLNIFYLAETTVKGDIAVGKAAKTLGYQYKVTNVPIYLMAKAVINTGLINYSIYVDGGVGPNNMQLRNYKEYSLDGGITRPRESFRTYTSHIVSATVGVGIRLNELLDNKYVDLTYRFFYLGNGRLARNNGQILNNLKSGTKQTNYANAIILSLVF